VPYATVALNDDVVPAAAPHAGAFLRAFHDRARAEQLPITFTVLERGRGATQRTILRAEFRVGGMLSRSSRYRLEVFADPVGSGLQVGFQLLEPVPGMLASPRVHEANRYVNSLPRNERELSSIMHAVERAVFVPVVQQLVDTV